MIVLTHSYRINRGNRELHHTRSTSKRGRWSKPIDPHTSPDDPAFRNTPVKVLKAAMDQRGARGSRLSSERSVNPRPSANTAACTSSVSTSSRGEPDHGPALPAASPVAALFTAPLST